MALTVTQPASGTPLSPLTIFLKLVESAGANVTLLTWNTTTDVVTSGTDAAGAVILPAAFIAELQRRVTNVITPTVADSDLDITTHALMSLIGVTDLTGSITADGAVSGALVTVVLSGFTAAQATYLAVTLAPAMGDPFFRVSQRASIDSNSLTLWRMDETAAADNAADDGGVYPLSVNGTVYVVAGTFSNGRAMSTGINTSSGYLSGAAAASVVTKIVSTRAWTVDFRISPLLLTDPRGDGFFGVGGDSNTWAFTVGYIPGTGLVIGSSDGVVFTSQAHAITLPLDTYTHLAFSYAADGTLKVYENGTETGSYALTIINQTIANPTWLVGRSAVALGDDRQAEAAFDHVRFSNVVRTAAEITLASTTGFFS